MEFEGRIAEMEAFLKKAAKMMRVQVEVVDPKIDNEIGGLKKEIAEKIEDRGGILKELKIYEDLKTARSKEYGGDGEGSLDEIRAYAREMIERDRETRGGRVRPCGLRAGDGRRGGGEAFGAVFCWERRELVLERW